MRDGAAGHGSAVRDRVARAYAEAVADAGVLAVADVPGRRSENESGALVAFLASTAGDYFSGCRFALR